MTSDTEPPTRQQLRELRAALPELAFDPARDHPVAPAKPANHYLSYYGLPFHERVFHRWGKVVCGAYTIATHYWLPEPSGAIPGRGMVLIVHGYFDHVGLYGHLVRHLLDKGCGVVAFDLPGHGLSSGERASIATFDHYVEVMEELLARLEARFAGPLGAVGQSTGGAILLKHLERGDSRDFTRVAVLAPLVAPAWWGLNKLTYALTHRFLKGIKRKFMANSGDPEFLPFLQADPLQSDYIPIEWIGAMKRWVEEVQSMAPCDAPVTIVQGTADKTLAWRSNLRLLEEKFPRARVEIVAGAQHHMVNETPELRERILERLGF